MVYVDSKLATPEPCPTIQRIYRHILVDKVEALEVRFCNGYRIGGPHNDENKHVEIFINRLMPGDVSPKFRASAVQAAPVFLDRHATIDKLDALVQRAMEAGADLVVFGERFAPSVWARDIPPVGAKTIQH